MNYQKNTVIKVNVMYETNKTRIEFINLAHITRFYTFDNYVIIELVNNVKLKVFDITVELICDKFFA